MARHPPGQLTGARTKACTLSVGAPSYDGRGAHASTAFLIVALRTPVAFGQFPSQTPDRVFTFTHGETVADLKEIAMIIRAMADIREVSVDDLSRAVTMRGTPSQIAIGEWVCHQLGEPAGEAASPVFQVPDASGDVIGVFYLASASTPVPLQQMATLVRSTGDIRRLFVYSSRKAIVAHGTPAHMAMAGWFVRELDNPSDPQVRHEFRAGDDDVCRVFFLENARNPQDVQDVVTTIRSIADVQRCSPDWPCQRVESAFVFSSGGPVMGEIGGPGAEVIAGERGGPVSPRVLHCLLADRRSG